MQAESWSHHLVVAGEPGGVQPPRYLRQYQQHEGSLEIHFHGGHRDAPVALHTAALPHVFEAKALI